MGDSVVNTGLMRLAEQVSRLLLPWQAVCCPRAVECVCDARLSTVQHRHEEFMRKMTTQLQQKVEVFISTKDGEVDEWMWREAQAWQEVRLAIISSIWLCI